MKCSQCQEAVPADLGFCPTCGCPAHALPDSPPVGTLEEGVPAGPPPPAPETRAPQPPPPTAPPPPAASPPPGRPGPSPQDFRPETPRPAPTLPWQAPIGPYSRLVALLLCVLPFLLVGLGGIHRMYTGKVGTGILQLLTGGGLLIWQLIDLVKICSGTYLDTYGCRLKS